MMILRVAIWFTEREDDEVFCSCGDGDEEKVEIWKIS